MKYLVKQIATLFIWLRTLEFIDLTHSYPGVFGFKENGKIVCLLATNSDDAKEMLKCFEANQGNDSIQGLVAKFPQDTQFGDSAVYYVGFLSTEMRDTYCELIEQETA